MAQRQDFHAGPIHEALDPSLERTNKFDPAAISKLRDLPYADRAKQDGAAVPPTVLDQFEWGRAQFRAWAQGVADRYGYQVRFEPVGADDPDAGPPTQLAVLSR